MPNRRETYDLDTSLNLFLPSQEALAVDNSWAYFVVVLPSDPLVDKGVEAGEDGATEPDGVFSGRLVVDVNWTRTVLRPLHLIKFVPETACKPIEQRVAARKDNIRVHLCLHVLFAPHDTLHHGQMEALHAALAAQCWLEKHFRAAETFVADENFAAVGHLVVHFAGVRLL